MTGVAFSIGGRALNRLGVHVEVETDESWQSYMWRVSRATGVPQVSAARALGVLPDAQTRVPGDYLLHPGDEVRKRWSGSDEQLDTMFLASFAPFWSLHSAPHSSRVLAQTEWLRVGSSAVCPECLAEGSGHLRIWWRLPFLSVCPVHKRLLSLTCPRCKMEHCSGRRDGSIAPLFGRFQADTRSCGNPANRAEAPERVEHLRACGLDLTAVVMPQVLCDAALDAQKWMLDVFQGRQRPTIGGVEVSPSEWVRDHRELMSWAMYAGGDALAAGLGPEVQEAWRARCDARDQRAHARRGVKSSEDRAFARTPDVVEALVASSWAVPILRCGDASVFTARVAEAYETTRWRRRSAADPLQRWSRNSLPFRVALQDARLGRGQVKAHLATHPLRCYAGRPARRRVDLAQFLSRGLPELYVKGKQATLLPAADVMVRFVGDLSARDWADAASRVEARVELGKLLHLVNVASADGWSRQLAYVVLSAAMGVWPPERDGQSLARRVVAEDIAGPADDADAPGEPRGCVLALALDPNAVGLSRLALEHLPASIAHEYLSPTLRTVVEAIKDASWIGRTALALLLAASATRGSLQDVATSLSIPWDLLGERLREATLVFRAHPERDRVEAELRSLLDAARSWRQPISFGELRAQLSSFEDVPEGDWAFIARRAGAAWGRGGGSRRYAAAVAWSVATGGDPHISPALTVGTQAKIRQRREVFARWKNGHAFTDELREALVVYGRYLAAGGRPGLFGEHCVATSRGAVGGLVGEAFGLQHVPPLLWEPVYRDHFAQLVAGLGVGQRVARASISVMLAQLTSEAPRAWITTYLGMPGRYGDGAVAATMQRLNASARADEIADRVRAVGDRLGEDMRRIDFARRRDAMRHFTDLSENDWEAVRSATSLRRGRKGGRTVFCAAWTWARVNESDVSWSPAYKALKAINRRAHDVYSAFARRTLPSITENLERVAHGIAARVDSEVRRG